MQDAPPPFVWRRPGTWMRQPWWPWARRGLSLAFFLLVGWLIVSRARLIEWAGVGQSLREIPNAVLATAAGVTALTYGIYCTFDLISRKVNGHRLPRRLVVLVTFISYSFNLNLGTLVGGVAFRLRLYGHYGLGGGQIAHITVLSMLTNWMGYCALAGVLFWFWPLPLPPQWGLAQVDTRWLGVLAAAVALGYLLLCIVRGGRGVMVRGRLIGMPGGPVALLQLAVSALHWLLTAGIIFVLLQGKASYAQVLATLMIAAIAGVIAHVPAGLGVIEAVFIALLGHVVDETDLLAALLGYRGLYYLAPLSAAGLCYLAVEVQRRRQAR